MSTYSMLIDHRTVPEGKAVVSPEHRGIRGTGVYGLGVCVCVCSSIISDCAPPPFTFIPPRVGIGKQMRNPC